MPLHLAAVQGLGMPQAARGGGRSVVHFSPLSMGTRLIPCPPMVEEMDCLVVHVTAAPSFPLLPAWAFSDQLIRLILPPPGQAGWIPAFSAGD